MALARRLAGFWVLTVVVLAGRVVAEERVPHVVAEAAVWDFGTVEQGEAVEHVFRLRNAGSGALRVDHVKGTCACTVGIATAEAVAPGDEAWVTVRLDTTRLAGRTTKTVTVYTNDPTTPTTPVTLTGTVLADLVVRPTPLYFGRVRRGTEVRRELAIASGRPGGTASVVGVEAAGPRLRAWLAAAPDGAQRVVVEITADAEAGRFSDDLLLRTTSTRQPTVSVKVLGTVEDDAG